jgi:ABC-type polysaccharide transport system permease subunit
MLVNGTCRLAGMCSFLRAHVGEFCNTSTFASEHATGRTTLATQVGLYMVIPSVVILLITEKILSIVSRDICAYGYCRGLNVAG